MCAHRRHLPHLAGWIAVLLFAFTARAVETLPVSALKPGMKGLTYTVLQGNKIEPLQTEILGVAKNALGPGYDMIIAKLVDQRTELTGAVHGMSGSPLYVDGKLVGALSRGIVPFIKDGQCGYTPIADMLDVDKRNVLAKYQPTSASLAAVKKVIPGARDDLQIEPLATPLSVTGLNSALWQQLAVKLGLDTKEFFAVPGGGQAAASPDTSADSLQPGAPVAAVLMTGSVSIAGTGTLTWREGNRIVAFGHPMLGLGDSELPMATAEIITTVPSYLMPFKMSNTGEIVGTVTQDRSSAIAGTVGPKPKLASYKVTRTSNGQSRPVIAGEFAPHPLLSPMLIGAALEAGLLDHNDLSRSFLLRVRGELKLAGHAPLQLDGIYSGEDFDIILAAMQILRPIVTLYGQSFERVRAESLTLQLDVADQLQLQNIESIRADRTQCRPGETIELSVELSTLYGGRSWERISVKLPENLKSGTLRLRVAGADSLNTATQRRGLNAAKSVDEMLAVLNNRRAADRLYAQVVTQASGVIVADRDMPSLPPSVQQVMQGGNHDPGLPTLNEQVWTETSRTVSGVVTGQQQVELELK